MKAVHFDWVRTGIYGTGLAVSIFSAAPPLAADSGLARGGTCCYYSYECESSGWCSFPGMYYCDFSTECGYTGSGAGECKCTW